ncbi:MAG: hypothetical protein Q9191_002140 [Dirinaria sp. TL-2023a]
MAKRKTLDQAQEEEETVSNESSTAESSSDDDDTDILDVEFEWFDPQPQHDFQGLKVLLRQLFDVDANAFNLSELADLILAQPLLGSTVKVDGNESDPYAFLTVLNLHEHRSKSAVQDIVNYIVAQSKTNDGLSLLEHLLGASSQTRVGLILTERLINIPPQVIPPMYKMLLEEISWAIDEKEPYEFSHYLILSKTYTEISSSADQENRTSKKKKKKQKTTSAATGNSSIFYFHPEDEILQQHASITGGFHYIKEGEDQSDSKRAFQEAGIKPLGHLMLIEASRFEAAVKAVEDYVQAT